MLNRTQYQAAFSHIRASETLRTEVLNMKPETREFRFPKRRLRPLLIAAACFCLLAGTALAIALNGTLLSYFETQWQAITGRSMEPSQSQLIQSLTTNIGDRVTSGGNTMTLESVTLGENSVWILLRLEAPATTFTQRNFYGFYGFDCAITPSPVPENTGFMGLTIQSETVNDDGSLSILLLLDTALPTDTALNYGNFTLTMQLHNLIDRTSAELRTVAEGTWDFSIPLQSADREASRSIQDLTVPAQIEETRESVEVELHHVVISSTGIRFSYTGEGDVSSISAILKDGTIIPATSGSSSKLGTPDTHSASYQWSVPLNPDDITALQIEDFQVAIS